MQDQVLVQVLDPEQDQAQELVLVLDPEVALAHRDHLDLVLELM